MNEDPFLQETSRFPQALRALLDAELAAGNRIVAVTHGHPAPPIGACLVLSRQVSSRPRASGDGLKFRAVNSALHSGQFTDDDEIFFLLEPPLPPPPEPDMDAIRAAANAPRPVPERKITPETPYVIELDHRGEMLTYRELDRSTTLACGFGRKVVLATRTLCDWWYPGERRVQPMTASEKAMVIERVKLYCYREQGVAHVELEE